MALSGLTTGNVFLAAAGGLAAASYAANWPLALSRGLRIAAFAIQILTILTMVAAVALLLALSENNWAAVPWWFWVIVAGVVFVIYKATSPGFTLLQEKL